MKYGYVSIDEHTDHDPKQTFEEAIAQHNIKLDGFIDDDQANKIHWEKRALKPLIEEQMQPGDELVCYEASNLARSTLQLLEIVDVMAERDLTLTVLKHNDHFVPKEDVTTEAFLSMLQNIENDFVARRTTDALARRRAAGLPLGRPKGRKNKSRKLDKYKPEIKKYLALRISKASIAKLVGCHAQTLYNYIEDKGLEEEVAREQASMQRERKKDTIVEN